MPKSKAKKSVKKTPAPYAAEDKADPMYVIAFLLSLSLSLRDAFDLSLRKCIPLLSIVCPKDFIDKNT